MRILVNGDLTLYQEFFKKYNIEIEIYENDKYIITLPENARLAKNVVSSHLHEHESRPLLNEYISSQDKSLKDFIAINGNIIASGDIQTATEDLEDKCDYIVNDKFRIFNIAPIRTYEFTTSGEISVEDYYMFLEHMLYNSSIIKSNSKKKSI